MSLGVILTALGVCLMFGSIGHVMYASGAPLYAWLFVGGIVAIIFGGLTWDWD
jgi:hypothetical protein